MGNGAQEKMDALILKALTRILKNQKEIKDSLNEIVDALNLMIKILERGQKHGKYNK